MKSKISKILGVGLSLVLLVSLMVIATPASAGTLAWSALSIPGAAGNVVPAAATDVSIVAVSPDGGTLFAVEPLSNKVMRSTDGGTTWTADSTTWPGAITAIAVSPAFSSDNTVYAAALNATKGQLLKSTNGGVTFIQVAADLAANETITSIALSPNFAVDGLLVVGTVNTAAPAFGDVYQMGKPATFGLNALGLAEDVTAVAFSPAYPSDRTILAVGSTAAATFLHSQVNWGGWDASWGGPAGVGIGALTEVGAVGAIVSSSLALPSDYNGLDITKRVAFVATNDGAVGGSLWRVSSATGTDLLAAAADYTGLAFSGTITAGGTLYAGTQATANVHRSTNALTAIAGAGTFVAAGLAPTGATDTVVAVSPDGAKVYAGTTGAESAFSVSTDGAIIFHQTALIDTALTNIADVTPSPAYDTDGTIFMVTDDGATISVWKTTNSGTSWTRVFNTAVVVANMGIIRVSPDFATDNMVLFAEKGTTGIWKSSNGGASWTFALSIALIQDIVIEDSITYYVGTQGGAKVEKNVNGAWHWGAGSLGVGNVNSVVQDANGDILVGNTAGSVYRSTDAGMTYVLVGNAGAMGAANAVVAAFDANYATNSTIYAGSATGTFRFVIGTSTVWGNIDATVTVVGLVCAPDGTLYAGLGGAGAGMMRALVPTATTPAFTAVVDAAGLVLTNLKYAPGSNVILGAATTKVQTYTDTLTGVVTLTSPGDGTQIATTATATLTWGAVAGATAYDVFVNTNSSFTGTAFNALGVATTTTNIAGLTPGSTYYWRVRVVTPVPSNLSSTRSVITALAPPGPVATAMFPVPGATGISITPTLTWAAVAGATGYEIVVGEDPTFAIIDWAATATSTALVSRETLDYSTTYHWRVRATSASSTSAWTVGSFTTMAEPVPDEPPVVVEQPTETETEYVEIPVPQEQAIPSYLLWTIIGVGAVLVIALIVLIVRTRRVA